VTGSIEIAAWALAREHGMTSSTANQADPECDLDYIPLVTQAVSNKRTSGG